MCYDLLEREYRDRNEPYKLFPFSTEGRDGGVDISGEDDDGNSIIIECKKNENHKAAENELKKLKKKRLEQLAKPNAENTIYRPWFSSGLKKYIYCTSCTIADDDQRDKFKAAVEAMLKLLATLHTDGGDKEENTRNSSPYGTNLLVKHRTGRNTHRLVVREWIEKKGLARIPTAHKGTCMGFDKSNALR